MKWNYKFREIKIVKSNSRIGFWFGNHLIEPSPLVLELAFIDGTIGESTHFSFYFFIRFYSLLVCVLFMNEMQQFFSFMFNQDRACTRWMYIIIIMKINYAV
jgi:hypothetical protein